jgi:hypothetical protein
MPLGVRPDDIQIHRLRVKAAPDEIEPLRRELCQARWPQADGHEWVFIRQLRVRAPRGRLAADVVTRTRHLVSDGGDGEVRRFSGLDDLLARLLADLAAGTASQRWYWHFWSDLFHLPRSQAMARLMRTHLDYLAAVTAQAARHGTLTRVWLTIDTADATSLALALARRAGLQWLAIPVRINKQEPALPALVLPTPARARWTQPLATLPTGDPRRLAAWILVAQETVPLLLSKAPTRLLAALDQILETRPQTGALAKPAFDPAGAAMPAPAGGGPPDKRQGLIRVEPQRSAHAISPEIHAEVKPAARHEPEISSRTINAAAPTVAESPGAQSHGPRRPSGSGVVEASEAIPGPTTAPADPVTWVAPGGSPGIEAGRLKPPGSGRIEPPRLRRDAQTLPAMATADRFQTQQGGLFYLLNFLHRKEAREAVTAVSNTSPASGWELLYRLGQELALDESDPVVFFLAQQMGIETVDGLSGLPPLPGRDLLLALAQRWYGRFDVWQPDLLQLEAQVQYTPSHVDLYASLASVRLPLRLAGLDLNPGWLPWLGRVVTFHYV